MAKSRIIPVRVDENLYCRIETISKERKCNFSEAARSVLSSGIKVIENQYDLFDVDNLTAYLHDILRYVIKLDVIILEGIIKEQNKDPEKVNKLYRQVLNNLEERGFGKPIIKMKNK
jgi:hypothetical protein